MGSLLFLSTPKLPTCGVVDCSVARRRPQL